MERSRHLVFGLVIALHVALLAGLVTLSRYRVERSPISRALELLSFTSDRRRDEPPARIAIQPEPYVPRVEASDFLELMPSPSIPENETAARAIDWGEEARRAVNAAANAAAVIAAPEPAPHSDWFPAPAHHKGDEVRGANGETMVFINEHCYQIASALPVLPGAGNMGMGNQTYCTGGSREPRGDLFKDLAAYKKLHPITLATSILPA